MPRSGGEAGKLGDAYEAEWVVRLMLGLLQGEYDALCWEPPGMEGYGVELWFEHEGVRTYIQSKRQNSDGNWTISRLAQEGVLEAIRRHLHGTGHRFWFVSQNPSPQLTAFLEEADKSQGDVETFWTSLPQGLREHQLSPLASALGLPLTEEVSSSAHLPDLIGLLRRVNVRVMDQRELRATNKTLAGSLVEGEAADVVLRLEDWAYAQMGKRLRATDIWAHLRSEGMQPRHWSRNARVLARIEKLNAQYVGESAATAQASHFVERSEVLEQAWERLRAMPPGNVLILHGTGGTGKSTVAGALLGRLGEERLPHLGFRLDQYPPLADAQLFGERSLNLPESPVRVLANVARGEAAWLVIDQLDEVSEASGRHASFFGCMQDMRTEQASLPGVRLVLVCRTFDLQHDHRIAQLAKRPDVESYEIPQFSEAEVRAALERLGFDPERFSLHQRTLLQIPRLLGLLAAIVHDETDHDGVLSFQNETDLYDRFWKDRDAKASLAGVDWVSGVDRMVDVLSQEQLPSASKQEMGKVQRAADWLVSNHILILQEGRYRFFHEGFFDYAFARRFGERDLRLEEVLRAQEQGLHWRRPVRQVLRYLRETNPQRYHQELRFVLQDPSVRPILKQSALAMISQIVDPTLDDWSALEPLLQQEGYPRLIQSALWGNPAWFVLLESEGVLTAWARGASPVAGVDTRLYALNFAREAVERSPAAAHRLLSRFVDEAIQQGSTYRYLGDIKSALEGDHTSRPLFDLYLRLVRSTDLLAREGEFLSGGVIYGMGRMRKRNPEWICELAGAALQRFAERIALDEKEEGRVSDRGGYFLQKLAVGAPRAFIEHILPPSLKLIEATAGDEDLPLRRAKSARWIWRGLGNLEEDQAALILASGKLDAASRRRVIETLKPHAEHYAASTLLLAEVFQHGGPAYADEALAWLLENRARFDLMGHEVDGGPIRSMIAALSPYAEAETLWTFEKAVLSHRFDWEARHLLSVFKERVGQTVEERLRWGTSFGKDTHLLLSALPSERLTPDGRRARAAHLRKFGEVKPHERRPMAPVVGPPRSVSRGKPERFRDEDWLRVLAKYANRSHRDRHNDFHFGGARELASVLKEQAKLDATRFVSLAQKLSDDLPAVYFQYILWGASEGKIAPSEVVRLARRCHALPSRPCGRWIPSLIEHHPIIQKDDRDEVVAMLTWYALEDPDPVKDHPNVGGSGRRDLVTEGINSVRGSAAEAIRRLLFENESWLGLFLPALRRMVRDPEVSVRAIVASTLLPVLNYDRDLAVSLFIELIADAPALLLGSHYVEQFINHALSTHHSILRPYLEAASTSDETTTAEAAARQLALAALFHEGTTVDLTPLTQSSASVRKGLAQVCAHNLGLASTPDVCASLLCDLFDDKADEVRKAAAECFDHLNKSNLRDYEEVARAFLVSSAFPHEYRQLVHALEGSTRLLPSLICETTERLVDCFGTALGDIQQASPLSAPTLGTLLSRVLSACHDPAIRARCLDGLDRLLLSGSYGILQTLDQASPG